MNIESIIRQALDEKINFSDIHAQSGEVPRMRVNGDLNPAGDECVEGSDILCFLQNLVTTDPEIMLDAGNGDSSFAFTLDRSRFRCELSWFSGTRQPSMVLRRLNETIPKLTDLGIPKVIEDLTRRSKGLVIVTGQTGSGKSTTLASMIEHINATLSGKIVTVEDPIEYVFHSNRCLITQREVGQDTPHFPVAVRAAMRQDPDVIMIGELRDKETVEAALSAAETGHLVLTTLHTTNAQQSIERISGFYDGTEKNWVLNILSSVLLGIISQVLIKNTQGGMTLCYEILTNTDAIAQGIRENKVAQMKNMILTSRSHGMCTLNSTLIAKVRNNEITEADALYATYDIDELKREFGHGR
ncbi:MAG: PilT/PilU family type 4a pilus ATPase [Pseudomonadota bacterium]|nr:PilT/PilU family type 4a pilus ATPase [Pseudomonadota bacterium]